MREGRVHWAEAVQRARTVADESLGRWPCCGNDPFVTQVTQIGFEPQEPGRGLSSGENERKAFSSPMALFKVLGAARRPITPEK